MRIPAGDRILFPVSGAQLKFFRAKTRPENAVGMLGAEVGALFRLSVGFIYISIFWASIVAPLYFAGSHSAKIVNNSRESLHKVT